jgi:hypothetical protein
MMKVPSSMEGVAVVVTALAGGAALGAFLASRYYSRAAPATLPAVGGGRHTQLFIFIIFHRRGLAPVLLAGHAWPRRVHEAPLRGHRYCFYLFYFNLFNK